MYKKFGDRLSEGDLFNQISNINAVGFQFTEGLKIDPITKALSEFKPNLAVNVLQNLEDEDAVKRDLEFFKKSGNRGFKASSYSLLGNIYSKRQDYAQALKSFEQALKINTEIGDRKYFI